jgi:hypothetical protein
MSFKSTKPQAALLLLAAEAGRAPQACSFLAHQSWPSLQSTVNIIPCSPLARILVPRPRISSPLTTPSLAMIVRTTSGYVTASADVCFVVLMTRSEFELQDRAGAQYNTLHQPLPSRGYLSVAWVRHSQHQGMSL